MGQMTYGLVYGIPDQDSEGFDSESVCDKYSKEHAAAIKSVAKKSGITYWEAKNQFVPEHESDSDPAFLGFFIAVGASGKDGVPFLEGFRIDALDTDERYMEAAKNAADRWAAFSGWCETEGITLPEPHIWLIETEVA